MDSVNSLGELFEMVSEYCRSEISEVAHKVWIKDITPVGMDGSTVTLSVKTDFKKKILEERYVKLLSTAFETVLGFPVNIHITVEIPSVPGQPAPRVLPEEPREIGDYDYTFDTLHTQPLWLWPQIPQAAITLFLSMGIPGSEKPTCSTLSATKSTKIIPDRISSM